MKWLRMTGHVACRRENIHIQFRMGNFKVRELLRSVDIDRNITQKDF